jgi:hypothetical protein
VKPLFAQFNFIHKIIACVKDEVSNLNKLGFVLSIKFFINHYNWRPFARICFGHAMSKACQYTINDAKDLQKTLKDAQQGLPKTTT